MRESGRFVLAILLMVAVIVGSNRLFAPEMPPAEAGPTTGQGVVPAADAPSAPVEVSAAAPVAQAAGEDGGWSSPQESVGVFQEEEVVVTSPLYRYTFSTRGGVLVGAELLDYKSAVGEGPVDLVPENGKSLYGHRVRIGDRFIDLRELEFRPEGPTAIELREGDAPQTLWFTHSSAEDGVRIRVGYTFTPDDYLIQVQGRVEEAVPAGNRYLLIELGPTLASHEPNEAEDNRALAYVVNKHRGGIESTPLRKVKNDRIEEGPHRWVALKNKYFLAAVLDNGNTEAGDATLGGVMASPTGEQNSVQVTTSLPVAGDGSFSYRVYFGPQEQGRLSAIGDGLQGVNPYGWSIFRPIISPLGQLITWALVGMHNVLGFAYGWVLILFGVLIRVILWPLNARAMRNSMKNMELQPKLKEIQEKYKDDKEKLAAEMQRLMKEEGFNPLGGCLPMLIPFPILITLFFVFQNTIEFRGTSFLWLSDLSAHDPFYILPILLGVSMFGLQWISMRSMPPNPQTKMLLFVMPVMMTFIFLKLSSGLILYYVAMNLASLPQQIMIARERRLHQEKKLAKAR